MTIQSERRDKECGAFLLEKGVDGFRDAAMHIYGVYEKLSAPGAENISNGEGIRVGCDRSIPCLSGCEVWTNLCDRSLL